MLRVVLLALLLLLGGNASSQEPPQRGNHPPTTEGAKPSTPDQRGSEEVPLVVKVLPAPSADAKADQEKQERNEKALIDQKLAFETQRIADYTRSLEFFTLCLFIVAFAQAGLFVWQLILIRSGTDDARIAANAAKASADLALQEFVIDYRDSANNIRTTGFCRIFDTPFREGESGRFIQMKKPDADYEYQD